MPVLTEPPLPRALGVVPVKAFVPSVVAACEWGVLEVVGIGAVGAQFVFVSVVPLLIPGAVVEVFVVVGDLVPFSQ